MSRLISRVFLSVWVRLSHEVHRFYQGGICTGTVHVVNSRCSQSICISIHLELEVTAFTERLKCQGVKSSNSSIASPRSYRAIAHKSTQVCGGSSKGGRRSLYVWLAVAPVSSSWRFLYASTTPGNMRLNISSLSSRMRLRC